MSDSPLARLHAARGKRTVRATLLVATLLGSLLTSPEGQAGGFHNPDLGVRKTGMFSVVGKPDDPTALFHNPAGLTLLEGTQLYAAGTAAIVDMGLRMYDSEGELHPRDHEITPTTYYGLSPFLGVVSDFDTERLRVAFGLYAPNFYGAFLPEDEPTRYHITEGFFVAAHSTLAAAYEVSDQFSFGAGLSLVYVRMEMKQFMNPLVLQNPDLRFSDDPSVRDSDLRMSVVGDDFTYTWNFGLLFHPFPELGLGASFTSGAAMDLRGKVKLTPNDGATMETGQTTEMVIPFTLRAGLNWGFAPNFEIGIDINWWHYQVLQEQVTRLDKPLVGMSELRSPKNYTNSWNWSVGLLHNLFDDVDIMCGYQEDYTPIPTTTFSLDNPTQNMHGIAMGTRWRISETVSTGASVVRNWYELIDVQDNQNNPPANVKGRGANLEVASEVSVTF